MCLSVKHTGELCKNGRTVWGWLTWDPRNNVLDGVKIGRIHSLPQGVTRRRCGLLPNYFGHLLLLHIITVNNVLLTGTLSRKYYGGTSHSLEGYCGDDRNKQLRRQSLNVLRMSPAAAVERMWFVKVQSVRMPRKRFKEMRAGWDERITSLCHHANVLLASLLSSILTVVAVYGT